MGTYYSVANSNEFKIKNLGDFKEGLRGYLGGEHDAPFQFNYSDYKRKSKEAILTVSSDDFSQILIRNESRIDTYEYIQDHIKEGEKCVIHLVEYEHGSDMEITRIEITSEVIAVVAILEQY